MKKQPRFEIVACKNGYQVRNFDHWQISKDDYACAKPEWVFEDIERAFEFIKANIMQPEE